MPNPFDNLISDDMKQLHCYAILEVVRAASLENILIFSTTQWTECPNCYFDPMTKRSGGKYRDGGPRPFAGICPTCNGLGRITDENTISFFAAVIFNQKNWCNQIKVAKTPDNLVATLSLPDTYDNIRAAKEIILSSELDASVKLRYQRYSEPLPCGFGMSCVLETIWTRVEN